MALQLMKLFVGVTTTTTAGPADTRFFYTTLAPVGAGSTLTIDAADFLMDDGNNVVSLPDLELNNSYFNVYVNAVLQMSGISTYTAGATGVGSLEIAVPAVGQGIPLNTPIVLEVVNFTPDSQNTVTT
ncbi:DUF4183 domain-containing protein [Bacillus sp. DNRA2]|uniref:DUF4183 domain-containing protein n=1 Tax=Bacillus sp. DNRA2 TaxID=2723053 RepID=UPI00145C3E57|nr:DUF4183 domain-containing protein [Bacillus sp. DNRA2]NMD69282.1 DUF4183 domain-containing protein [Bacillus sp. DNRA2]